MKNKVAIGVIDLSFHRVAGSLVANTLMEIGFEVERVYAHHESNFERLRSGEVDMLASAWLPSSHGGYKKEVEETVRLIELGLHYEPYALWGVPDFIPESAVAEVSDLLKPEVREKMCLDIQGINPGAGISRFSQKMIANYCLGDAGYKFHTGTEEDCFGTFERAVKEQTWIVVPLWQPQFLHYKYKIRELKDPKGLLGTVDRAVLLLREDRRSLFSDEQRNKLDELRFSNEIIAKLDYKVCRENQALDEVTRHWQASR
jgi:glycine betaine/proline transport system substrate-binding protein